MAFDRKNVLSALITRLKTTPNVKSVTRSQSFYENAQFEDYPIIFVLPVTENSNLDLSQALVWSKEVKLFVAVTVQDNEELLSETLDDMVTSIASSLSDAGPKKGRSTLGGVVSDVVIKDISYAVDGSKGIAEACLNLDIRLRD